MTSTDEFLKAWQEQQEAFWASLKGGAGSAAESYGEIARKAASFWGLSTADMMGTAFPNATEASALFSGPEFLASARELNEAQVKQFSDFWAGLVGLPAVKMAVEQALRGLSLMQAVQSLNEDNPLLSAPFADSVRKYAKGTETAWAGMLEAYKDLLSLYGSYPERVSSHLLADLEGVENEIDSPKKLLDLWFKAAESVHSEITYTQKYQEAFGRFSNNLLQALSLQRDVVEDLLERIGIPTYSELTDVHARIQRLRKNERRVRNELREVSDRIGEIQAEIRNSADVPEALRKSAEEMARMRETLAAAAREVASLQGDLNELRPTLPALEAAERAIHELTQRVGRLEAAATQRPNGQSAEQPAPAPEHAVHSPSRRGTGARAKGAEK